MLRGTMLLLLLVASPAVAQDAPIVDQPRCWVGSIGFTEGATARAAETTMECQADHTWAETTKDAAGCFYGGNIYAVGAVTHISNFDDFVLACEPDGTWSHLIPE